MFKLLALVLVFGAGVLVGNGTVEVNLNSDKVSEAQKWSEEKYLEGKEAVVESLTDGETK